VRRWGTDWGHAAAHAITAHRLRQASTATMPKLSSLVRGRAGGEAAGRGALFGIPGSRRGRFGAQYRNARGHKPRTTPRDTGRVTRSKRDGAQGAQGSPPPSTRARRCDRHLRHNCKSRRRRDTKTHSGRSTSGRARSCNSVLSRTRQWSCRERASRQTAETTARTCRS
jgi:hypothetical protein